MARQIFTQLIILSLGLLAAGTTMFAADVQPKDSPFIPRDRPVLLPGTAAEGYQLTGYVALGKGGMLSVTRLTDRRSYWIPLGETVREITALSYDSTLDQAVIRANGQTLTIALKKAATLSGANVAPQAARAEPQFQSQTPTPAPPVVIAADGTPVADNSAPANPVPATPAKPPEPRPPAPGTQAFQEREARMLVTDLLEIGMQQRKAYEEAQRQAAAQGSREPRADAATPPR